MLDKAEAAEAKLAAKGNRIAEISVDEIKSILLRRGVDQQLSCIKSGVLLRALWL